MHIACIRHGCSCQSAWLELDTLVSKVRNEGRSEALMCTDQRAACNLVKVDILVSKLRVFGVEESSLLLIKSYLTVHSGILQVLHHQTKLWSWSGVHGRTPVLCGHTLRRVCCCLTCYGPPWIRSCSRCPYSLLTRMMSLLWVMGTQKLRYNLLLISWWRSFLPILALMEWQWTLTSPSWYCSVVDDDDVSARACWRSLWGGF